MSTSTLPLILQTLKQKPGAGVVFINPSTSSDTYSFLTGDPAQIGFWYQSTSSCQPEVYIVRLNSLKPEPLETFFNRTDVKSLRLLKIKDTYNESVFRGLLLAMILSDSNRSEFIEKLVMSGQMPLLDYLRTITLLPRSGCGAGGATSSNPYLPENILQQESSIIDQKIDHAISKLSGYLKRHDQNPPHRVNSYQPCRNTATLEQTLFETVANVSK